MWNGLSIPTANVGHFELSERAGPSVRRLIDHLGRRRGLGVKLERPQRSEDERA